MQRRTFLQLTTGSALGLAQSPVPFAEARPSGFPLPAGEG